MNYYYWTINPEKGEVMAEVKAFHLGLLPIKNISITKQQPFIELADKMLSLNAELNDKKSRFIRRLEQNFENIKIKGGLNEPTTNQKMYKIKDGYLWNITSKFQKTKEKAR